MMTFDLKKWNTLLGWGVFVVALIVFGLTVEPTASYWDCAEYISTSAKLQVGHPPGAPLFQMLGAFFAMFASEPDQIALMVNYMSVISSAFAVLFMFWTITLFLKRMVAGSGEMTNASAAAILASGALGALAFTFTDSFWFNAVEAEVYAMATFIMALMFWLALRWEQDMHKPRGNKWLVLICFVIGLSFGVHFMGLLTIPAIGMIYFYKNYPQVTTKNFIIANIVAVAILLFIFKLLLPSTLKLFGYLEVFFVNDLGFPFNSGTIFAGLLLVAVFYFALRYTRKKDLVHANTLILGVLFILIGFSTWVMIPIRANANTSINENSPSDARQLLAYYNLEQYPETHLFYGPMYTDMYALQDRTDPFRDDKPKYERDEKSGKYVIVNDWKDALLNPNSDHVGFLPRLWSTENAVNYMKWTGPPEFKLKREVIGDRDREYVARARAVVNNFRDDYIRGEVDEEDYHDFLKQTASVVDVERPSLWTNFKFLIDYQIGEMYVRYFAWNFIGRQNDEQWRGDNNGKWLSGIKPVDELVVGPQDNIPSDMANNKARNTYYFLPLIFGLIGFFYLLFRYPNQFWVLFLLFVFTGLAIQVYTNVRPFEPRERDYSLVGSFYVFAIWIGFSLYALFDLLKNRVKPKLLVIALTGVSFLSVPVLLAAENWDDHDRSDRYTAQSTAKAYLDSCQEDAIIFTIGDNDTFALWYAQEIEGYRTDVRTVNTSLLATDWYIDQMKRKIYKSDPVPSQLEHYQYAFGVNDYIIHESLPQFDSTRLDIKQFMDWITSDSPKTKIRYIMQQTRPEEIPLRPKSYLNRVYYPTNKLRIPVNKENVLKYGIVEAKDADKIVDYIDIDLPTSGIGKNRLMMLDIIANNDWKRPIYFTGGSFDAAEYIWMKDYLQLEGLTYKLVPIRTPIDRNNPYEMGRINTDSMYETVMKWDWGNSESPNIYHDPETRKNSISFRSNMARLMEQLLTEGKNDKAKKVADLAMEKMPITYFGYYSLVEPFVAGYYELGEQERAREVFAGLAVKYQENLRYYASLPLNTQYNLFGEDIIVDIERYRSLVDVVVRNGDKEILEQELDTFIEVSRPLAHLYGGNYDFYTIMDGYVEGYYRAESNERGRELYQKIASEYQERLDKISGLDSSDQLSFGRDILREIEGYRRLVDIVVIHEDSVTVAEETEKFNSYVLLFSSLYGDEQEKDPF